LSGGNEKMDIIKHTSAFMESIKDDIKGPLIVGVSGGPDSLCLLHVLVQIKSKINIDIHVAHLNHLLRGAESDDDADYVAKISSSLGVLATIVRRNINRGKKVSSIEEAARNTRYAYLLEVAGELGSSHIAVAHTANDQVETIFMNIIRGTGLDGLRGMKEISTRYEKTADRSVTIIRPLLQVSREDTLQYCEKHNLQPRFDSSNKSTLLRRNKFRIELLPELKKYNPRIRESLLRTSELAGEVVDYFNEEVSRMAGVVYNINDNNTKIQRKLFLDLPNILQKQVVRKIIQSLIGNLTDIE
jgi:tRNA(Ile)-lysidine synthase